MTGYSCERGEQGLSPGVVSVRSRDVERMQELIEELSAHRAALAEQAELCRQSRSELASTQDRYFELYEGSPLGYLTLDRGRRVARVNHAALDFLRLERDDLVGHRLDELLTADEAARFRHALASVFDDASRLELDLTFCHRVRPARSARVLLAKTGASALVTLQQLKEPARPDSSPNAEVRAIWDTLADPIIAVDAGRRITICNAAAERLFGLQRHELVGMHVARLLPAFPDRPTPHPLEQFALSRGTPVPVELAVTELSGREGCHVAVVADVSQRKREQAERNEALMRFNQLVEHLEDVFYVASAAKGRSLYVSPAFTSIYGRPLVAHEGEPWPRLAWVHPEDRDAVAEAAELARFGEGFDVEYRVVHPDGETRLVRDRAFFVPDGTRITGIVRDVTEERRLAEDLKKSQRLEAMGTLASGVAHDFNNLLMGIGGCVQLALRRVDPADATHGYLERAADAILRGANLTKQILRIGDTRRVTEGQVVLDDVVLGSRELVGSLIGETIALQVETGAAGLRVVAEAADIEQILMNLVSNARDAMPKGGLLTLSTGVEDDMVTLAVADTGVGMSASVKGRVFEPFFTTKRAGKGTGLGLATVFALARRLGGTVALESEEGHGTTVYVSVPLARRPSQIPTFLASVPKSGGEVVLLVDDDPLVRLTVENHLESLGYRALVASNAEEAISFCEDESLSIDLVVTDVMMPGMLGPDLMRELESRERNLPVLYMSAHSRETLVAEGRIESSARLLAKPFDANTLAEAVTSVLDETRRAAEGVTRKTLLVDDDRDTTDVLCELLELEGHEVRAANGPAEALAIAGDFAPDFVLCDLDLGAKKSGYELTSELRRDPRLLATTFVALTGYAPEEVRDRARDAGFAKVLAKPLDVTKLRRLLRGPRL